MRKLSNLKNYVSEYPWYIAVAIGAFFPPGLILPVICTFYEYKHNIHVSKSILYSAIASLIFSLFMSGYILMVSFTGNLGTYALASMYIPAFVLSIYLFSVYTIFARRSKYFEQILLLITIEHITSIPQISEITGLDQKKTILYLKKIIKMGELAGAEVYDNSEEIIFKKSVWARQRVICRNCAASLVVNFGHTLTCEYCKSALEIERTR